MDMEIEKEKNPTFKCPSCGMTLSVEEKSEADKEHGEPKKAMNAGNMPMDKLKSKLPMNKPPASQGNLNAY